MKIIISMLMLISLQMCSQVKKPQNTEVMENYTTKNNPYYSRTDEVNWTSLTVNGKKFFLPICMQLQEKLQPKDLLQGNTMNLTNWAIIIVRFAEIIFSVQILNSHPPADGRVFLKLIRKEQRINATRRTEWKG